MKKTFFVIIFLFFVIDLYSQEKDSVNKFVFPKHEVKVSFGDPMNINESWETYYCGTLSVSYLYRIKKWLWVGTNVFNYIGMVNYYSLREYDTENNYTDYQYNTRDYGFGLIPEIRFSYLNKNKATLYSGLALGYSLIKSYTNGIPNKIAGKATAQVTIFGYSGYFGKNKKIFMGGEWGCGCKGMFSIHAGYRF